MTRYRISNSAKIASEFARYARGIDDPDERRLALISAKWLLSELERTPLEMGESRGLYRHAGMLARIAFAGPLVVEFAVREDAKTVFIKRLGPKKAVGS